MADFCFFVCFFLLSFSFNPSFCVEVRSDVILVEPSVDSEVLGVSVVLVDVVVGAAADLEGR